VVKGLVNRRSGDSRKGEKQLCLEGVPQPGTIWEKVGINIPALIRKFVS
jgi:hypothetical protein